MSQVNYLGGLKKEYHHIKVPKEGGEAYEPAMVILKEKLKGRSFIIPFYAFWKYVDPKMNQDVFAEDRREFLLMVKRAEFRKSMAASPGEMFGANVDLACCIVAEAFSRGTGILLTVSWNLAKILQMMEITPCPQAAAQLLLWIQDGLDTLKNMPPAPEDDLVGTAGEMTLFADGEKMGTRVLEITETDLAETVH